MTSQSADTLFQLLAEATPQYMRFPPDQPRKIVADIIGRTSLDLDTFYDTYKRCRAGETWIRDLKQNEYRFKKRQSLIAKFRAAWASEIEENKDFWGDLFIVAAWSHHTRRDVAILHRDDQIIHWIKDPSHDPSKTFILTQRSRSSCKFASTQEQWHALETKRMIGTVDDNIRQTVRASRYTLGFDGATGKISRADTKKQVTVQDILFVKNPVTGRSIKIGSDTYNRLLRSGVIKSELGGEIGGHQRM